MGGSGKIIALDRSAARLQRLTANAKLAGASMISAQCQDFLETDPLSPEMAAVTAILLDPSCSGSGTVSRRTTYSL